MPPVRQERIRQHLMLEQKIAILDYIKSHPEHSQNDVAAHFRSNGLETITQSSVSRILKDAAKLYELALVAQNLSFKRRRIVEHPEVEAALEAWILQALGKKISISGELIRVKAREFARQFNIAPEEFLSLSNGWLDSFKARHGLKEYRWHGEAGSVALTSVDVARERLRKLTSEYRLCDIWNMDETGLFGKMPPDRGLATRAMAGLKAEKSRITYAFTVNADGTERLPPFIIGHARHPRCFNHQDGASLGFDYHWNLKGWMTGILFAEYLLSFDRYLSQENRHILLLVDNAASHHTIDSSQYTHIRIEYFEPNMTSHIQPLDQGIIRCWKAQYRRLFCERAAERERDGELDIYGINQLEIMQLAHTAWMYVTDSTIANCWRHARILAPRAPDGTVLPDIEEILPHMANEDEGLQDACAGLVDAVAELQEVGALGRSVVMDLEELLDDVEEGITEREWTDAEIVEQVRTELQGLDLVQGTEEEEEEEDEPVLAVMSDAVALTTVRALGRYLATQTDPALRDGATWCSKFSRLIRLKQVRSMSQSSILDYLMS